MLHRILHDADPYDQDTSGIDTSMPRVAAGLYELQVRKGEKAPNKDGTKENMNFELVTTQQATSTTGEVVQPGHVLFHTISITPTEKYNAAAVARNVASMCQSAGVNAKVRDIMDNPALLAGKFVIAKVSIQKETEEYPERNTIKAFVVKK